MMLVACLGRTPRFDLEHLASTGSKSTSIDETEKKIILCVSQDLFESECVLTKICLHPLFSHLKLSVQKI